MKSILAIPLFVLMLACGSKSTVDEAAFQSSLDSAAKAAVAVDPEVVTSILEQIPSPLEISMLLKQSGSKYNNAFLNATGNVSKYNTNYQKALNLGIYGADLGYTNIYEQNAEGVKYLSSIKSLADDLNIGQFFDVSTIARLAANSDNLDSLLLVTTQNFNSINQYLQGQGRANLSVLLLVGGWVEAMELMCQVASQNPQNKELLERIGEQKITLEQIALLLSFYKDDGQMGILAKELEELKALYDKVEIIYTYKESTMEVVNGVAVIKDNSTTTINITEQNAAEIRNKVNAIRKTIVS